MQEILQEKHITLLEEDLFSSPGFRCILTCNCAPFNIVHTRTFFMCTFKRSEGYHCRHFLYPFPWARCNPGNKARAVQSCTAILPGQPVFPRRLGCLCLPREASQVAARVSPEASQGIPAGYCSSGKGRRGVGQALAPNVQSSPSPRDSPCQAQ